MFLDTCTRKEEDTGLLIKFYSHILSKKFKCEIFTAVA
jgi:hypothetical protein